MVLVSWFRGVPLVAGAVPEGAGQADEAPARIGEARGDVVQRVGDGRQVAQGVAELRRPGGRCDGLGLTLGIVVEARLVAERVADALEVARPRGLVGKRGGVRERVLDGRHPVERGLVGVGGGDRRAIQVAGHGEDIAEAVIGEIGVPAERIGHPAHQVAAGQVGDVPHIGRLLRLGGAQGERVGQRIAGGIEGDAPDIPPRVRDVGLRDHAVAIHRVGELVGAGVGQVCWVTRRLVTSQTFVKYTIWRPSLIVSISAYCTPCAL
jgi:hypothetical protein